MEAIAHSSIKKNLSGIAQKFKNWIATTLVNFQSQFS